VLEALHVLGADMPESLRSARLELRQVILKKGSAFPEILTTLVAGLWVISGQPDARDAVAAVSTYLWHVANAFQTGITRNQLVGIADKFLNFHRDQLSKQASSQSQLSPGALELITRALGRAPVPDRPQRPVEGDQPGLLNDLEGGLRRLGRLSQAYEFGQDSLYDRRSERTRVGASGGGVSGSVEREETRVPRRDLPRVGGIDAEVEEDSPFDDAQEV